MKMDRIWKKLILRIKDESYREQVYWWFQDQKPYGFWEKDSLTIVAYVRDWPEESFQNTLLQLNAMNQMKIGLRN